MKKRILIMLSIITIALSIIGCAQSCPEMGKSAPEFTLQNTDDKSVNLSDFRGKTLIINFWATWCGPCQFETPFFQAIHNERASKGVVILAIDVKENPALVKSFVNSKGITFPVLLDTEAQVAQKYCLPNALPVTLFVNTEGIIKARKIGAFQSQAEIAGILDSLK
jgi:peroxiredoxin